MCQGQLTNTGPLDSGELEMSLQCQAGESTCDVVYVTLMALPASKDV